MPDHVLFPSTGSFRMDVSTVRPSHSTLRGTPTSIGSNLPKGAVIAVTVLDDLIMLRSEDFGCRVVLDAGRDEV
jgi:hypothetical protein